MRTDRESVAGRLGHSRHTATVLVAVLAGACSDAIAPRLESDPGGFVATVTALAAASHPVAFVSLPPGQIPGGIQATLHTVRVSGAITIPLTDGGFDPVPVPAAEGDTITIAVATATGTVSTYTVIPRRSRPTIVRTSPPKGKRDVAVNSHVAIIFSEPIDPATLTTTSIQLRSGGIAVPGQIRIVGSIGTVIEFIPGVVLEESTDYELVLTDAIRDREGAPLVAVSVPFTTGTATVNPVESVTVEPNVIQLEVGTSVIMTALLRDAAGTTLSGRTVVWSSSDSTLATVDASPPSGSALPASMVNALVVGGPVTITATSEGKSGSALVTVIPTSPPPPADTTHRLAFVRAGDIYTIKEDGSDFRRLTTIGNAEDPAWSPDGRQIAFVRRVGTPFSGEIYLMNADGSGMGLFTVGRSPAWSPDGRRIAYQAVSSGGWKIFISPVSPDGSSTVEIGFDRGYHDFPAWSPDGSKLAFVSDWVAFDFAMEVHVANVDGSGTVQLTDGYAGSRSTWPAYTTYAQPAWSPDGSSLTVVACQEWQFTPCEQSSVGILNADGSGFRHLAQTTGYARPAWSPDGTKVVFARTCWDHTCPSSIYLVGANGAGERILMGDAHSPAWRR